MSEFEGWGSSIRGITRSQLNWFTVEMIHIKKVIFSHIVGYKCKLHLSTE